MTQVLGRGALHPVGALSMMILEDGPLFIGDTHVHTEPTPQQLAEITIGAARHVRRFGVEPKIALCAQSQFGNQPGGTGERVRAALDILDASQTDFAYEGEMNIDAALDPELRARILPQGRLDGAANVLIFAHADAASGVRNILKMKGGGLEVGPILMGMGNRAHIVSPSITARGLLNMGCDCRHACRAIRLKLWEGSSGPSQTPTPYLQIHTMNFANPPSIFSFATRHRKFAKFCGHLARDLTADGPATERHKLSFLPIAP